MSDMPPTAEDIREVEEMLAKASNAPTLIVPGAESVDIAPEMDDPAMAAAELGDGPTTFQEMTYFMVDEVLAGDVLVGWHEEGVAAYWDRGTPTPDGVTVVTPDETGDYLLLVGIMVMQIMGRVQAEQMVQSANARRLIAETEAGSKLIVPGQGLNRQQRRAQGRRR